jgi:hypothetical protein
MRANRAEPYVASLSATLRRAAFSSPHRAGHGRSANALPAGRSCFARHRGLRTSVASAIRTSNFFQRLSLCSFTPISRAHWATLASPSIASRTASRLNSINPLAHFTAPDRSSRQSKVSVSLRSGHSRSERNESDAILAAFDTCIRKDNEDFGCKFKSRRFGCHRCRWQTHYPY